MSNAYVLEKLQQALAAVIVGGEPLRLRLAGAVEVLGTLDEEKHWKQQSSDLALLHFREWRAHFTGSGTIIAVVTGLPSDEAERLAGDLLVIYAEAVRGST